MSFKDMEIKSSYNSSYDNIVDDFYIKVLKKSINYKRIAGFFSSSALKVCGQGIEELVSNNGKMKLIISPKVSAKDAKMMELTAIDPYKIIEKSMLLEVDKMLSVKDIIEKDHVLAFGWLMAKGFLDVKIAVVVNNYNNLLPYEYIENSGLFHMKVGIMEDNYGNKISFSGSINETESAWISNIEEFKVFKSWVYGQEEYCQDDNEKFDNLWNNKTNGVKVMDIPKAVSKKIIEAVPTNYKISNKRSKRDDNFGLDINLFPYQKDAIKAWLDNQNKLIFEMATGTGKTIAALGCISSINKNEDSIVYFIVCPQNTLFLQWKKDIDNFNIKKDIDIIADSTNPTWRVKLEKTLLEIQLGIKKRAFVYTTFATFSSDNFIETISNNKFEIKYMLIADEVHGIGSEKRSKGLLREYDYRLGLSATPERWFDEKGTELINLYFGSNRFVFDMSDALNTINPLTGKTYLTPFKYIPLYTVLTNEEIEEYNKLSASIARSYHNENIDEELYEMLIFKRANIYKNAENKYEVINKIFSNNTIKDTIIFLSNEQIDKVLKLTSKNGLKAHKFTQEKGTSQLEEYDGKTERELIIDRFVNKDYDALLAIKCLDEGIDIPSASKAILMSNTTNPREYIQRIGRVIRRHEGKEIAIIYDIIIVPSYEKIDHKLKDLEFKIFEKEIDRVLYIAKNAINSTDVIIDIQRKMEELQNEFKKNS